MITQELVKELFTYKDGQLIRLVKVNNRGLKGAIVGSLSFYGYLDVRVKGKLYKVHRLIFLYHYGYFPERIDHINGNKSDNRIENLRECTQRQNTYNSKKRENTTSRFKGVSWDKGKRLWTASIRANKKPLNLGKFWDEETAAQVVTIARLKYHGNFANNG